jgi:tetratricopeptide (TPR) repeat protein
MRLFSTVALSLALVATGGLIAPGAALAQKKGKEEAAAPAKLSASQNFFKVAKPLQDLLAAKNFDGALGMMPQAEAAATTPDDRYFVGNFWLNIGIGKQDQATQLKGVEMMLASGKVAPTDLAKIETAAGGLSSNLKNTEAARKHYTAAIAAGADPSETEALVAETYFSEAYAQIEGNGFTAAGRAKAIEGLPHLRKAIDAQVAKGTAPALNWYERGFQTSVVALSPDAFDWAKLTLAQTDKASDWRIALRLLQETYKDMPRPANIDLMRLMYDAKALQNDYSYSEFIDALWKSGQPGELKTIIDSGRATGEVKATQFSDFYKLATDSIAKDKAGLPASEKTAAAAPNGKAASRTADAYLGYGDYAKAIELYKLALTKGGVDNDEVNTRLGIALWRSGDSAGAKAAFAAVSATSPARKQIADLWTIWLSHKSKAPAQAAL